MYTGGGNPPGKDRRDQSSKTSTTHRGSNEINVVFTTHWNQCSFHNPLKSMKFSRDKTDLIPNQFWLPPWTFNNSVTTSWPLLFVWQNLITKMNFARAVRCRNGKTQIEDTSRKVKDWRALLDYLLLWCMIHNPQNTINKWICGSLEGLLVDYLLLLW